MVQGRPEPITRSREVVTHGSGVQARIDSAEQDIEIRGYHIRYALPTCRIEFCGSRARPGGAGGDDWAKSGRAGGEDWA